ncbi:hypothetical protein ACFQMA_22450 [Halosimplex aquaticum]|uniref:Uncharacterized protein n=1 Tax=Halosimplex aquaticum TaxID=3026162 RepID=A0ABD5YE21_9EURY|nr:hypothetical protein [Halosimplex aquaticum]
MSGDHNQFRFSDDGGLKEPDDEEEEQTKTNDLGEEMPYWQTAGGFRRDVIVSALQSAIRRSDEEVASFCAFELVRSGPGYETQMWNRLALICVEDLVAGNEAIEHVLRYEDLAKNRWEDSEWQRRLCAIAATLVAARARSSRATTHANGYFSNTMEDRARAKQDDDHEPLYEPPVTEDDLSKGGRYDVVLDKHTRPGAGHHNRGWEHFRVHGARIGPEPETDHGEKWWRRVLEYDHPDYAYREPEQAFTDEEIDHAVEPTPKDDPWRCGFDEDADLDEFDAQGE